MKPLSQRRAEQRSAKLARGREIVERNPCNAGVSEPLPLYPR